MHECGDLRRSASSHMARSNALSGALKDAEAAFMSELVTRETHLEEQVTGVAALSAACLLLPTQATHKSIQQSMLSLACVATSC